MKKKILLFCLLMITLFLIIGCGKEEQEPETDQEIKTSEPTQESAEKTEQGEQGKILTLIRCSDNKIEAELYNNKEEPLVIGDDIKIIVRGLIVPIPECDNNTIKPGETVYCSDITGKYKIKDGVNKIQANLLRERAIEYIDCSVETS